MFSFRKMTVLAPKKGNGWRLAWSQPAFRKRTLLGIALNIPVLIFFPFFFQYVEQRTGRPLHDTLLDHLPASNVSFTIFFIIWSMALLTLIRASSKPQIFITFLYSFFLLSLSRIITITIVPLAPPQNLIPLVDPLSNAFYGNSFVTKDLFYSGHVATQFLMFLCLQKKVDKILAVLSTISVAVLVLVQHVHYSIDVIAAPFFAFLCFAAGRSMATKGIEFQKSP